MEKVSQQRLIKIIERHKKFLMGSSGGQRAILKFKDLSGLDFRLCDLSNADLSGACLNDANLSQATFSNTNFFSCDLLRAKLNNSDFTRADFRGACIINADLTDSNFAHADFRQGYLLNYANSENAEDTDWGQSGDTELSGSVIRDTDLSNIMGQNTNFSDANLQGVTMHNANLQGADLSSTNLTGTDFMGSNMARTKLKNAIVNDTNLNGVTGDISVLENIIEEQKNLKRFNSKDRKRNIGIMVKNHSLWVASAGGNGEQLNLSDYDLSHEQDISQYPLSIIIATNCKFTALDLENISMQSSILNDSDFRDCAAHAADFRGSSFKNSAFTRADLSHADFSALTVMQGDKIISSQPCDLSKAKLAYTNLENANFKEANLTGADFSHADMRGVNLTDADLTNTIFNNANLEGTTLTGTILDKKKNA